MDSEIIFAEISWLRHQGFNIWYDEGITIGTRWSEELATNLAGARLILYFITSSSVRSRHCQDEISFALDGEIPAIAVHLEATELTPGLRLRLNSHQAIYRYETNIQTYRQKLLAAVDRILAGPIKSGRQPGGEAGATPSTVRLQKIAVLPFVNMSSDLDNEYFSDGISEEILGSLVKINRIPVIARSSSFQFKGENRDVTDIGRMLGVTHLLEGSVRKAGEVVRITAQLIDVGSGTHLWSDTYDRKLVDVFEIQDEIAEKIVNQIGLALDPSDMQQDGVRSARSKSTTEGYDLYLRGVHAMNSDNPFETEKAIPLFEQAIALDQDYADAWAGLGFCYLQLSDLPIVKRIPSEVNPTAINALQRALKIDPNHAFATGWLGYALICHKYEWDEGLRLMKLSLAINPQDAQLLSFYGFLLANMKREEGDAILEKAYLINPLDPLVILMRAIRLALSNRFLDAAALMETALIQNRDGFAPNSMAAFFNALISRVDIAEKYLDKAKKVVGADYPALMPTEYLIAKNRENFDVANELKSRIFSGAIRQRIPFLFYIDWNQEELETILDIILNQQHAEAQAFLFDEKPHLISESKWQEIQTIARISAASVANK